MRLHEFVTENATAGATGSGSIATVAQPLGGMITRNGGSFFTGANTTDEFPNTPYKRKKKSKFQKIYYITEK
jgi:hypothetical protein